MVKTNFQAATYIIGHIILSELIFILESLFLLIIPFRDFSVYAI